VVLPAEVPLWVAAHGPKGYAVAERVADAVLTNLGHGSANVFTKLPRVFIVHYGTVLEEGESLASERVLAAAGPAAALHLHLADDGAAAGMEECVAYHERLARIDERRRHLELHRSHLIEVTELERPFVTPALIERTTGTGTLDRVREQLLEMQQAGATGVLYGPIGPDIPRELRTFAEAAEAVRCGRPVPAA
jgi:5,10-methylenetetrahydromethanopterin reductase